MPLSSLLCLNVPALLKLQTTGLSLVAIYSRRLSPKYSININGQYVGSFSGKQGLRQGDPLSLLCVQVFSDLLAKAISEGTVHFHPRCLKLKLTHLCFADDLMIFTAATRESLQGVL